MVMTKAGWEKRRAFDREQFGSEKLAREARSRQMSAMGKLGGGSPKRDPATRSFADVKMATKAAIKRQAGMTPTERSELGKKAINTRWGQREKQRIIGGREG